MFVIFYFLAQAGTQYDFLNTTHNIISYDFFYSPYEHDTLEENTASIDLDNI